MTYQTFRYYYHAVVPHKNKSHSEKFDITYYNRNLKPIDAIREYIGLVLWQKAIIRNDTKEIGHITLNGKQSLINIMTKEISRN